MVGSFLIILSTLFSIRETRQGSCFSSYFIPDILKVQTLGILTLLQCKEKDMFHATVKHIDQVLPFMPLTSGPYGEAA